jgi:hypothetical protein
MKALLPGAKEIEGMGATTDAFVCLPSANRRFPKFPLGQVSMPGLYNFLNVGISIICVCVIVLSFNFSIIFICIYTCMI